MQKSKPNSIIAGIDEVGKGSLFGPVFAAAVVLDTTNENELIAKGLKDSKLLSHKKRAQLVPLIKELSISWGIGQSSAREIDSLGIRTATENAMVKAIESLSIKPTLLLVDGSLPIRIWKGAQETLIKGESKSVQIAAASVIAKEERDKLIKALAIDFPGYGLEKNVGYGTNLHCKQLVRVGYTKMHRKTFLKKILSKNRI